MLLLIPLLLAFPQDAADDPTPIGWGHSHLGTHYDEGPRRAPWPMPGIGRVHFEVTTANAEVQPWFDQGLALLHSFWPFEAERSFRHCAQLDPECAMAYCGLAMATKGERQQAFLDQAVLLRETASEREQAFIDLALAKRAVEDARIEDKDAAEDALRLHIDRMVMEHPGEVEILAFAALEVMDRDFFKHENRVAIESMLQRVLALQPDHPGAMHYRVHNWDGTDGAFAIDSCTSLTAIAPESGHLQHMPGHVLSNIGMWHEAAIALDSATRVEQRYMNRRLVMPEDNWNYMHNLDYLAYVQGQLGMQGEAIATAKQLLVIPLHSVSGGGPGGGGSPGSLKRAAILRELARAERWETILDGALFDWPKRLEPDERMQRNYYEARAHIAQGNLEGARDLIRTLSKTKEAMLEMMETMVPDPDMAELGKKMIGGVIDAQVRELDGRIALAEGRSLEAIQLLTTSAEIQEDVWMNDPPMVPDFGFNVLGEALLELNSPTLAIPAFERTLKTIPHDSIALAGLVRAYHSTGNAELASAAMAALDVVWAEANPISARYLAARATGIAPATGDVPKRFRQLMAQRQYGRHVLNKLGPCAYDPAVVPEFAAMNAEGEEVTLADYDGKAVLLIFYLGDECTHCIDQLKKADKDYRTFRDLGVEILAVSKDSVEEIEKAQGSFKITLLSDPEFVNAKRFGSFDDFEGVELHSTVLIDANRRVHFIKTGGEPFEDFDFLEAEAERLFEGGVVHGIRGAAAVEAPAGI